MPGCEIFIRKCSSERRRDTTVIAQMSDSGNFEFNQTPQPTDQPAAGWYFAQGDPPGTERYWSGAAWEGSYRAVGGFSPTEVTKPVSFPGWTKAIAWVLTVLKAFPLMGLALLVVLWGSLTQQIQDETDFRFREFSLIVLVIGLSVVVVGAVLLLGQLITVSKEQPGRAMVWSGILTLIDALFAVGTLADGGVGNAVFFIVLLVLQGGLFAMMAKVWNDQRAESTV